MLQIDFRAKIRYTDSNRNCKGGEFMRTVIIGGGAAGMMAALTAAGRGIDVILLERQNRVGRKLLATGNGRCNLTNLNLSAENYHGAPNSFITPALDAFGAADTLEFFP